MLRKCPRELWYFLSVLALTLSLGLSAWAGPPTAPAPAKPAAPAANAMPDYGGLSATPGGTLDAGGGAGSALNPVAQAGRAFEALVIVLAVVVGGMLLLKRFGLIKGDDASRASGPPTLSSLMPKFSLPRSRAPLTDNAGATELLSVLGSQTLPHSPGAVLHLISVGGRVLLLGATGQSVTLLTEVAEFAETPPTEPAAETPEEATAFADYLARVGIAAPGGTGAESTRASLAAAADRLQSLMSRGPK